MDCCQFFLSSCHSYRAGYQERGLFSVFQVFGQHSAGQMSLTQTPGQWKYRGMSKAAVPGVLPCFPIAMWIHWLSRKSWSPSLLPPSALCSPSLGCAVGWTQNPADRLQRTGPLALLPLNKTFLRSPGLNVSGYLLEKEDWKARKVWEALQVLISNN